jgi:hypothetical protein
LAILLSPQPKETEPCQPYLQSPPLRNPLFSPLCEFVPFPIPARHARHAPTPRAGAFPYPPQARQPRQAIEALDSRHPIVDKTKTQTRGGAV